MTGGVRMTRKHIVIAMYDEKYVASLEIGFLKNAYESIRLETITEEGFFEQYFNTPQIIDCLIIDEKLYTENISRQGINQVFVLAGDDSEENKYYYANVISKFSSVKEIIHKVTGKLGISMGIGEKTGRRSRSGFYNGIFPHRRSGKNHGGNGTLLSARAFKQKGNLCKS